MRDAKCAPPNPLQETRNKKRRRSLDRWRPKVRTAARVRHRSDSKSPAPHGCGANVIRRDRADFTKFRGVPAFASWMGACRDNDISSGKIAWVRTSIVKCRAATALRISAQSLHHSESALGEFYVLTRAKLGAPKAITAAAYKLARIIFHLISPARSSRIPSSPPTNSASSNAGNQTPRQRQIDGL